MSKQRGKQNRERFQIWISEMNSKDRPNWIDYWHGNTLSPKKIADELGFCSSAFKKARNPKLHEMLNQLRQDLATKGVFQEKRVAGSPNLKRINPADIFQEEVKDSAHVRELKKAISRLQNENAKLNAEVERLIEFKDVLTEMGLWK